MRTLRESLSVSGLTGAEGQNRTADTVIFSHVLYQLSYLGTGGASKKLADKKAYHAVWTVPDRGPSSALLRD
jgi:hypothetical protein